MPQRVHAGPCRPRSHGALSSILRVNKHCAVTSLHAAEPRGLQHLQVCLMLGVHWPGGSTMLLDSTSSLESHHQWRTGATIEAVWSRLCEVQLPGNMLHAETLVHLVLLLRTCSEDTLRLHFSQYGAVEATDIMKDRLSGKSRGFGFVTFVDPACAAAALQVEHTIDGRRCEAKVALPKVSSTHLASCPAAVLPAAHARRTSAALWDATCSAAVAFNPVKDAALSCSHTAASS